MSAETLRTAAQRIREDWMPGDVVDDTLLAVADWLEAIAARAVDIAGTIRSAGVAESVIANTLPGFPQALAVARAYLGDTP